VLATDIDAGPLEYAASVARELGIGNVEFRVIPCERLGELGATFDAAISRNGLQYLYDLPKGFAQIYSVVRHGGTVSAVAWSAPERNPFLSTSFGITYRKLGRRPPTRDEPSPFRLGYDKALQSALEGSGFRSVSVVAVFALTRFQSAAEATQFLQEAAGELLRLRTGFRTRHGPKYGMKSRKRFARSNATARSSLTANSSSELARNSDHDARLDGLQQHAPRGRLQCAAQSSFFCLTAV